MTTYQQRLDDLLRRRQALADSITDLTSRYGYARFVYIPDPSPTYIEDDETVHVITRIGGGPR